MSKCPFHRKDMFESYCKSSMAPYINISRDKSRIKEFCKDWRDKPQDRHTKCEYYPDNCDIYGNYGDNYSRNEVCFNCNDCKGMMSGT